MITPLFPTSAANKKKISDDDDDDDTANNEKRVLGKLSRLLVNRQRTSTIALFLVYTLAYVAPLTFCATIGNCAFPAAATFCLEQSADISIAVDASFPQ